MAYSPKFPIFTSMHIKSALIRGEFHPVYCEDFLFHTALNDSIYLAAVMDGCSMGNHSHFASALVGKILNKIIREMGFQEFYGEMLPLDQIPLPKLGKMIVRRIHEEMRKLANQLHLDQLDLLTTINLSLVNHATNLAWAIVIGDGVIVADDKIIEIEQGNRPNYMAYHLAEDFDGWYAGEQNSFGFNDIQQLIICSDGVVSFEKMDKSKPDPDQSVESYLLMNTEFEETQHPFDKRIEKLNESHGFIGTDDISIIYLNWKQK